MLVFREVTYDILVVYIDDGFFSEYVTDFPLQVLHILYE